MLPQVIEPEDDHGLADRVHLPRQVVEARIDALQHTIGKRNVLRQQALDLFYGRVVVPECGDQP
jgi:hypothetical protein